MNSTWRATTSVSPSLHLPLLLLSHLAISSSTLSGRVRAEIGFRLYISISPLTISGSSGIHNYVCSRRHSRTSSEYFCNLFVSHFEILMRLLQSSVDDGDRDVHRSADRPEVLSKSLSATERELTCKLSLWFANFHLSLSGIEYNPESRRRSRCSTGRNNMSAVDWLWQW